MRVAPHGGWQTRSLAPSHPVYQQQIKCVRLTLLHEGDYIWLDHLQSKLSSDWKLSFQNIFILFLFIDESVRTLQHCVWARAFVFIKWSSCFFIKSGRGWKLLLDVINTVHNWWLPNDCRPASRPFDRVLIYLILNCHPWLSCVQSVTCVCKTGHHSVAFK